MTSLVEQGQDFGTIQPVIGLQSSHDVPVDFREDWGAQPPKGNPGGFVDLVSTVLHYTAANQGYMVGEAGDHTRCHEQVRSIQRQHQGDPSQTDISYNALACSHGRLIEGRVLGYKGGANGTASSNETMPSICCLVGVGDVPTPPMLSAVQEFHARVEAKAAVLLLPMLGHRDLYATSCPGDWLYAWVEAQGYRLPTAPNPAPQEDDVASVLLAVMEHPGFDPRTQVMYLADGKYMVHRWVQDEQEFVSLQSDFAILGWPSAPVPVPHRDLGKFGVLLGPAPH